MMKNRNKKEVLFLAGVLLAAAVLWMGIRLTHREDTGSILITVDGEEYGTWPLSENQIIKINDTNVCEIEDGKVRMVEAECPDHLCIKQGAIGANGGLIVCLPNRVVIQGIAPESAGDEVDGVVN